MGREGGDSERPSRGVRGAGHLLLFDLRALDPRAVLLIGKNVLSYMIMICAVSLYLYTSPKEFIFFKKRNSCKETFWNIFKLGKFSSPKSTLGELWTSVYIGGKGPESMEFASLEHLHLHPILPPAASGNHKLTSFPRSLFSYESAIEVNICLSLSCVTLA